MWYSRFAVGFAVKMSGTCVMLLFYNNNGSWTIFLVSIIFLVNIAQELNCSQLGHVVRQKIVGIVRRWEEEDLEVPDYSGLITSEAISRTLRCLMVNKNVC